MSSTMSLNTRVHIVSRSGKKETITARELLDRGTGSAFEAFQMLDDYEELAKAYDAERRAISDKNDREDHLPLGAHLLPQDYQDFLYSWNKLIADTMGWWNGEDRANFWKTNPQHKIQWDMEHGWFRQRYSAEIKAVKAYQATHSLEDSDDEQEAPSPVTVVEEDQFQSLDIDNLPFLPPSPAPAQQLAEQPDTDGEDDQAQLDDQQPKKPHNPIYTNYKWPSPIAKVFVQHIRGNNAWDSGRNIWWRSDGAWAPDFKVQWRSAGNTEFKLTHDNCMRYLAYRMGRITLSKLLEMEPTEVHAKLIGANHGVRGFFTKPYTYAYGYY